MNELFLSVSGIANRWSATPCLQILWYYDWSARDCKSESAQYFAYCKAIERKAAIGSTRTAWYHFDIGTTVSLVVGNIVFPLRNLWISFDLHVVHAHTPTLLFNDYMDRLGVYLKNSDNVLIHRTSVEKADTSRLDGYPYLQWNAEITHFMLTELKCLHRSLGEPHFEKLVNILSNSELSMITPETWRMLAKIERAFPAYQEYAQRPQKFKHTLREEFGFKHNIFVDIFYIRRKPVLHFVGEATRFQAATWLPNVSSECLWKALRHEWIDVYIGPREVKVHDEKKRHGTYIFGWCRHDSHRDKFCAGWGIKNYFNRWDIRGAVSKIILNYWKEAANLGDDYDLQLNLYAITGSADPDGIAPKLLIFGALPRLRLPADELKA